MSGRYSTVYTLALLPILVAPLIVPVGAQQHRAMPNNMFTASGFAVKFADTPAKLAELKALPADKMVVRKRDGKTYFVYADPAGCVCAYVGTPEAYEAFRSGGRTPVYSDGRDRGQSTEQMIRDMQRDNAAADPGVAAGLDFIFR